jgi:hypothetical protein
MEELLNAFLAGLNLWVGGGGNAIFIYLSFNVSCFVLKKIILALCGMSVYPWFEAGDLRSRLNPAPQKLILAF